MKRTYVKGPTPKPVIAHQEAIYYHDGKKTPVKVMLTKLERNVLKLTQQTEGHIWPIED